MNILYFNFCLRMFPNTIEAFSSPLFPVSRNKSGDNPIKNCSINKPKSFTSDKNRIDDIQVTLVIRGRNVPFWKANTKFAN